MGFIAASILGSVILLSSIWWRGKIGIFPVPVPQWIQALAAVLLGTGFGLWGRAGRWRYLGAVVTFATLLVLLALPVPGISIPYWIGLVLCPFAVWLGSRLPSWISVQPVADCMLGVYLVHILALGITNRLLPEGTMASVIVAFSISFAGVFLARRVFPPSRIVLG